MTQSTQDIPDELNVLAGEYVLGALDAPEMRAVRRQAMVNPVLAAAITGWEGRLAPMTQAVPALPPPEALWARIEQMIAPLPDESVDDEAPNSVVQHLSPRQAPVSEASALPEHPPQEALTRLRPTSGSPRQRVWPWQLATGASLALAAGVAGVVLMPAMALRLHVPLLGERFAPVVAVLMPADSRVQTVSADTRGDGAAPQLASHSSTTPGFLVEVRPDGPTPAPAPAERNLTGFLAEARPDGTLVLAALAPVELPGGRSLELWILPPGAAAPKSLGVLPAGGHRVVLPAMPPPGTALMVSLEPPGGSPTGVPTGPVVYSGKLGSL